MNSLQAADVQPTANQLAAIAAARKIAGTAMLKWQSLKTIELQSLNVKLKAAGLAPLKIS